MALLNAPKAVVKVDKLTREVVESYKSIYEAAKRNGISTNTIQSACANRSLPSGRLYFRYAADYDQNEEFQGKFNCPIVLMDVEKGVSRLRWFPSMKACCDETDVPRYELIRAISGRRLLYGRYAVRYCPKRINATVKQHDGKDDDES